MQIANVKVSRSKAPPGACVEFVGQDGQTIEIELRGEGVAEMSDEDIIAHAKSTMGDVNAASDGNPRPGPAVAGVD
jgi:hypothetical protein